MPTVGGKKYPYTPTGIAMAQNKAQKQGKQVDYSTQTKTVAQKPIRTSTLYRHLITRII